MRGQDRQSGINPASLRLRAQPASASKDREGGGGAQELCFNSFKLGSFL